MTKSESFQAFFSCFLIGFGLSAIARSFYLAKQLDK